MSVGVESPEAYYNPEDMIAGIRRPKLPNSGRVVVTSAEAWTGMGFGLEHTFDQLSAGRSSIIAVPKAQNFRTRIAGPLYPELYENPTAYVPQNKLEDLAKDGKRMSVSEALTYTGAYEFYTPGERRRTSFAVAATTRLAHYLARKAQLVDENDKLKPGIVNEDLGIMGSSGLGSADGVIDIFEDLHSILKDDGTYDFEKASRWAVDTYGGSKAFVQDVTGDPAKFLGARGISLYLASACASGGSAIDALYKAITRGDIKEGFALAVETTVDTRLMVTLASFAKMKVTSARNDDPTRASRPWDIARDGFVPGSGVAGIGLAELNYALERGAPIIAEVYGTSSSIDADDRTNMNPQNVARTLLEALPIDYRTGRPFTPDTVYAHATSTKEGDIQETTALALAFPDTVTEFDITGVKSGIGHTLGAAGAINAALAVESIRRQQVLYTQNLDEVDPKILDIAKLKIVREQNLQKRIRLILCMAMGFGGFNAFLTIGPYIPDLNHLLPRAA